MTWIGFTLLSALAFASADAATKRYFADAAVWDTAVVRFVLPGAVLLPWVATHVVLPGEWRFWTVLGCMLPLDLLALVLYIRAITSAPLSHTLPYLAFAPVFTVASGWVLLGERVSPAGLGGILLVSAGAWVLNTSRADRRIDPLAPVRFLRRETGPRLMLAVAALFSLTATLGKAALGFMPALEFGPFYAFALGAITLAVVAPRRGEAFAIVHRRPIGASARERRHGRHDGHTLPRD